MKLCIENYSIWILKRDKEMEENLLLSALYRFKWNKIFLIKLNIINLHEVKLGHPLFEPSLSCSLTIYSEGKEIWNNLFCRGRIHLKGWLKGSESYKKDVILVLEREVPD